MKKSISCLLILAMILSVGMVAYAEEEIDYLKDIPYIDDGDEDHLLDVFGFDENVKSKPTVIEVHGGGFYIGRRTDSSHFRASRDAQKCDGTGERPMVE